MSILKKIHEILGSLNEEEFTSLKNSINRDGIFHQILVRKDTGEIIDGTHRAKISKKCKKLELDVDDREAARLAVTLNLSRRQIEPRKKERVIKLLRKENFTQKEVAEMVGVSQGRVSQIEKNISSNIPRWRDAKDYVGKSAPKTIEFGTLYLNQNGGLCLELNECPGYKERPSIYIPKYSPLYNNFKKALRGAAHSEIKDFRESGKYILNILKAA